MEVIYKFKKQNIPQYLSFASDSFHQIYPAFKKRRTNIQSFNQSAVKLIDLFLQASDRFNENKDTDIPYNTYTLVNGKMASVLFTCDMYEFIHVVRHQLKDRFFEGSSAHFIESIKPEKAIFGTRGIINRQYRNKGILQQHIIVRNQLFINNGIEFGYGWSINPPFDLMAKQLANCLAPTHQNLERPIQLMGTHFNLKLRPAL